MNKLDPINLTIEFVRQTVDPGGGGEVVNAQTGDIAIWAILAILFVGVIAYCMFRFSRVFNGEYATAIASAKHAKNARGGGRLVTTKAVLIAAVVGLIACLSITTSTAIAASNHANSLIQPDKIQVAINEETGEVDTASFNFVNTTNDYYLFEQSSVSLTDAAKEISESSDWGLTINGMNADLFKGEPNGETQTIENSVQTLYPGQTSAGTLTFSTFDPEIAKQLIGKSVFNITLEPDQYVITVPKAETDLVYNGSVLTGVKDGVGYNLSEVYQAKDAGNYTAVATPTGSYKWPDKTQTGAPIPWSIAKAQGEFSVLPAAINDLVYTGESLPLVIAGQSLYTDNIEYSADGGASFSSTVPQKTDHGTYTVLAHVCADSNHEQSANVEISGINIEKAVLSSITVLGATGSAEFKAGDSYVFPDFTPPKPQSAYTIDGYVVEQGTPLLFKAEKVTPGPIDPEAYKDTQIKIENAQESDIGTHTFVLPGVDKWNYNDDNVTVKADAWKITNGSFTINKVAFVEISVVASPTTAKIDQSVKYNVSMTNKLETAITGAKLWFGNEEQTETIDLAKGETKTIDITYEVNDVDFLYYPTMTKNFTLKYEDYSVQTSCSVTLQYTYIIPPTLYNKAYDGYEHSFEEPSPGVGYTFVDGTEKATNAGQYYAWVIRNAGYIWEDLPYLDFRVYAWEIKKIDVNVHLTMPAGKNYFEVTFGDVWTVEQHPIIGTTSDGKTIQGDALNTILGGEPSCIPTYHQYSEVKTEPYKLVVNLPTSTGWNPNYNISKEDADLVVLKKDISITWPTKEFKYTGLKLSIPITINGNLPEHSAVVKVETFTDPLRQNQKDFIDKGNYYATAMLSADSVDNPNYCITGGTDKPADVFKITDTPAPPTAKSPKAILTRENKVFGNEKSLIFVYDDTQYTPDPLFIEAVYDVTPTIFDPTGTSSQYPSWYEQNPKVVRIEESFKEFTEFSESQNTAFTSMDLWFANMSSLEKIEGLENIHEGITSLNATFMNTNLDDYTFPDGFFNGVTSTHSMFKGCSNVEELDVSNWTYTSFENTTSMFQGCSALQHIYCKEGTNWAGKTPAVASSQDMFDGCTVLTKTEGDQSNDINNAHAPSVASQYAAYFEAKTPLPTHNYLYEYSAEELKQVSNYLAKHYTEQSQDPVCVKFRSFRDNGLTTDGTDNGVGIATNPNKINHWAIDKDGKLYGQEGFVNDNTTIQARIIGICEDKDANGNNIGLTFMTTHALNAKSAYESDGTAEYGWSGDGEDSSTSSCTLRTMLANVSLFPEKLRDVVTTAAKGYQFSSYKRRSYSTAYDKFWSPSMIEMYGVSSRDNWPKDHEGSQYKAFLNKITEWNYEPFANIDQFQSGGGNRTSYVLSRSLFTADSKTACVVRGNSDGAPSYKDVKIESGVVACFCI